MVGKIPSAVQNVGPQSLSAQQVLEGARGPKLPNAAEASKTHQLFSKLKDVLLGKDHFYNYQFDQKIDGKKSSITISITGSRRDIKELKRLIKGDGNNNVAKTVKKLAKTLIPQLQNGKSSKPTALSPASARAHSFPSVEHSNLKRATIHLLLTKTQIPGQEPLSTAISRAGLSNAMDIPQLIAELPILYPQASPSKLASMRVDLTTQWMSLEAGHEWGIGLTYSIGGESYSTASNLSIITNAKASLLVDNFMKAEQGNIPLSEKGKEKVKQAALSGAKAAQNTNANYHKNNQGLRSPEANLSTGKELRKDLDENGIINIPTGWARHAVGITLHKAADGKYFLYYCNRGGKGFEKTEDRKIMGGQKEDSRNMVCYEIGNPEALTPELLGQIAGCKFYHSDPDTTNAFAKPFIEGKSGIFEKLNLQKAAEIPKTPQKIGNCSWANCKGSIHAAAIAAAYDDLVTANPQGQRAQMMNQAVNTGGVIFKKMERFGRKQSLAPLLKYNGMDSKATISPFDHMRVLSAAGQKLSKKIQETNNSGPTRQDDVEMKLQLQGYLNQCPYPITTISHRGMDNIISKELQTALLNAGEGAFAFSGSTCFIVTNQTISYISVINPNQTLSSFLKETQTKYPQLNLTFPVMLERPFTDINQDTHR